MVMRVMRLNVTTTLNKDPELMLMMGVVKPPLPGRGWGLYAKKEYDVTQKRTTMRNKKHWFKTSYWGS